MALDSARASFRSSPWPLRSQHLYLLPGDSPVGLRLPLSSLPWVAPEDMEVDHGRDPFDPPKDLPDPGKAALPKVSPDGKKTGYDPLCLTRFTRPAWRVAHDQSTCIAARLWHGAAVRVISALRPTWFALRIGLRKTHSGNDSLEGD